MLYLIDGIPTLAHASIHLCTASMSRSRCGLSPSMIAARGVRSTWLEERNGGVYMSTVTPNFSARSLIFESSSTAGYPSGHAPLSQQMLFTLCRLKNCRRFSVVGVL